MGLEHVVARGTRHHEALAWALGGAPAYGVALVLRKYGGSGNRDMKTLIDAVLAEARMLAERENWPVQPRSRELRGVAMAVVGEIMSSRLCPVCGGRGTLIIGDGLTPCPLSDEGGVNPGRRARCVDGIHPWGLRRRSAEAGISEGTFRRHGWPTRYRRLLYVILQWEEDVRRRMAMRMRDP